jgi:hypothetical protein
LINPPQTSQSDFPSLIRASTSSGEAGIILTKSKVIIIISFIVIIVSFPLPECKVTEMIEKYLTTKGEKYVA